MPLDPVTELATLVDALESDGVPYALCGGLALAVHGHPRMTKDIDLLIRAEDLDRVLAVARSVGFDLKTRRMRFGLRVGKVREVQRVSKIDPDTGDLLMLDLMFVNDELEAVWTARTRVVWG